ncbi:hypothetical protein EYF80_039062 [Liparis tanakae]|uniref:Uncharacterized protein n=1 Tax=Liparis tanakae TaxID=230148 RepID=A0A4Z2GBX7_9TELE|nr:hypothetical protein EYF80_039062 [Liparis tanakae]
MKGNVKKTNRPRPLPRRPYTSLEPWLVQEEKLSYSESLREPTASGPRLEEDGSSAPRRSSSPRPASASPSPRPPPEPASGYRLPLLEPLWFSRSRDSVEKSRELGGPLTGALSAGTSFCGERGRAIKTGRRKTEIYGMEVESRGGETELCRRLAGHFSPKSHTTTHMRTSEENNNRYEHPGVVYEDLDCIRLKERPGELVTGPIGIATPPQRLSGCLLLQSARPGEQLPAQVESEHDARRRSPPRRFPLLPASSDVARGNKFLPNKGWKQRKQRKTVNKQEVN